jgi:hypothetical protein
MDKAIVFGPKRLLVQFPLADNIFFFFPMAKINLKSILIMLKIFLVIIFDPKASFRNEFFAKRHSFIKAVFWP